MKILLIGSTGVIGSRIAAEARNRGHEVTGATRSGTDGVVLDAADEAAVAEAAKGQDAVVVAVTPPRDGTPPAPHILAVGRALLGGVRAAGSGRLVIVGGAGSLEVAPGLRLVDAPDFPEIYYAEATAHADLLDLIRADADGVDWTYISPAAEIAPGERTGHYRRGGDELIVDADGNSRISAEDFALALVDELETGQAHRGRITFAY
ncbi:NAD(P)-dependent oxidoreductase [Actinomadura rayongensis]|uniref:NAD(P)H-binding protein n=1 Tax=Actinomadura rayongensis TaxID=1429076 RepID=A0A6I4WAS7_9ACTN|nr:NAD(P)H-binding protein [Actinomadura rayongensis]MXQ63842.1 NAD(P)H-binding protein [Actinomadura rayongensis]